MSILNLTDFVAEYGFFTFTAMLRYMRKVVFTYLGVDPYIVGVMGHADQINAHLANELPLDGATGYALLPDWEGPPVQEYRFLVEKRVSEWYALQETLQIPFFPVVCAGWDATVRGEHLPALSEATGFPWRPVVTGVTAEDFGYFLDCAIDFNRRTHPSQNIVFIHAWNEWTESSVVEPSDRFGTRFLEEIRKRSEQFRSAAF